VCGIWQRLWASKQGREKREQISGKCLHADIARKENLKKSHSKAMLHTVIRQLLLCRCPDLQRGVLLCSETPRHRATSSVRFTALRKNRNNALGAQDGGYLRAFQAAEQQLRRRHPCVGKLSVSVRRSSLKCFFALQFPLKSSNAYFSLISKQTNISCLRVVNSREIRLPRTPARREA
jgi:hypothetical protein